MSVCVCTWCIGEYREIGDVCTSKAYTRKDRIDYFRFDQIGSDWIGLHSFAFDLIRQDQIR